jgi:hypothetical protein
VDRRSRMITAGDSFRARHSVEEAHGPATSLANTDGGGQVRVQPAGWRHRKVVNRRRAMVPTAAPLGSDPTPAWRCCGRPRGAGRAPQALAIHPSRRGMSQRPRRTPESAHAAATASAGFAPRGSGEAPWSPTTLRQDGIRHVAAQRRRGPQVRQDRGRANESIARSTPCGAAAPPPKGARNCTMAGDSAVTPGGRGLGAAQRCVSRRSRR